MNNYMLIYTLIGALIIIGAVIGGISAAVIFARRTGKFVARNACGRLKRFSAVRRYRVLKNVKVNTKDGEKEISLVLIGIFGIIAVDAHPFKGELYGTMDEKEWCVTAQKDGAKERIPNLVLELQGKADALRRKLTEQGIYKVDIDYVNVVQSSEKGLGVYVADSLPVIRLNAMGRFLAKGKYNQDKGIDLEKLEKAILK